MAKVSKGKDCYCGVLGDKYMGSKLARISCGLEISSSGVILRVNIDTFYSSLRQVPGFMDIIQVGVNIATTREKKNQHTPF